MLPMTHVPVRLTRREREIAEQVKCGRNNREIAAALHISEQTVKNQLCAIYEKLGVRNRTELALYAVRHDL